MSLQQASHAMATLEIKDFSGGLIDKVDDALLPENASSDCQNFIVDTLGKLRKRPGQSKTHAVGLGGVIQGMYPYYYSNTNALIVVSNGTAYVKKYAVTTIEVWTATDLDNVRHDMTASYVQMANIDLSSIPYWSPIGSITDQFTGSYDGNNFTISNVNSTQAVVDCKGLFSAVGTTGSISNVKLSVVRMTGHNGVGGLVGTNYGTITQCSISAATINGTSVVGGLVGLNAGTIEKCSAVGSAAGTTGYVGGLVGQQRGTITNSYSNVSVSGYTTAIGGLAGDNSIMESSVGTITNCYSIGYVSSSAEANYPFLRSVTPTTPPEGTTYIYTFSDLNNVRNNLAGTYALANDINVPAGYIWWEPIGTESAPFTGSFYGQGHTIMNLIITGSNNDSGLFGYMSSSAKVEDLTLRSMTIDVDSSTMQVGGIAGTCNGDISRCAVTYCNIGSGWMVGGIVGYLGVTGRVTLCTASGTVSGMAGVGGVVGGCSGFITNCYSLVNVYCRELVGGFCGMLDHSAAIGHCYCVGLVVCKLVASNPSYGGLVGYLVEGPSGTGTVINSYYNSEVSGRTDTDKGTPKTTVQLQTRSTFVDWDFDTIWDIPEEATYLGGLIGDNYVGVAGAAGVVTSSYYNSETSGQSDSTKGTPKTTAQLRTQSTFTGWDFSAVWAITAGAYPVLRIVSSTETADFTPIKTGLNDTNKVHFETCANYMVAFNGYDAPWKYNGATVSALANAPSKGKFAVLHNEQLFCVDTTEPSTLLWSDLIDPETWPATHYLTVKDGDGDKITNIQKFLGELLIFKRRSIHTLRGTTIDDFRKDELDSRIGCVGEFAAVVNGTNVFFVSDEGLCAFNGVKVINLSENKIPNLWGNIAIDYLENAVAGYWDGYVWFALTEKGYTYNNLVLLYSVSANNVLEGTFWPCRAINMSCCASYVSENLSGFYTGDSTPNGFVRRQWVGTEDDTEPVSAYWVGKHYNVNLPEHLKKAKKIFITDSVDTVNKITLSLSFDYGNYTEVPLVRNDSLVRQFKTNHTAKFRYVSPKVEHNSAGACEVRGILMPCKVKTKPKVLGV
jgi:hypothetical protein